MISIDTFIEIGSQHKVCEDYILSGTDPLPFIILADGCSSSDDSEMGARILCHLAKQYIQYNGIDSKNIDYEGRLGNWVIHNAEMIARQLGLKKTCLDATLIVAYVIDDYFYAHMYGDGFILLESTSWESILYDLRWITYSKNAPYYLNYEIDDERARMYREMKIKKELNYLYIPNGKDIPKIEPIKCPSYVPYVFLHSMKEHHKILICSDGISSFLDPMAGINSNKLIEVHTLLHEIFGFKNTKGKFLKRRCNKYMKQLKKIGVEHFDDLAIGAFLYKDEKDGAKT
jgi:serine/threonine protein phosphatase PrpC